MGTIKIDDTAANPNLIIVTSGECQDSEYLIQRTYSLLRIAAKRTGFDPIYVRVLLNEGEKPNFDVIREKLGVRMGQYPSHLPVLALGQLAQKILGIEVENLWRREREVLTNRLAIAAIHPYDVIKQKGGSTKEKNDIKAIHIIKAMEKFNQPVKSWPLPPLPLIVSSVRELRNSGIERLFWGSGRIVVDIETNTTDWTAPDAKLLLLGIGVAAELGQDPRKVGTKAVILTPKFLFSDDGKGWLDEFFQTHQHRIGGHNFKFDTLFSRKKLGLKPWVQGWDTIHMVNAYHPFWLKDLKSLVGYFFDAEAYEERLVKGSLDAWKEAESNRRGEYLRSFADIVHYLEGPKKEQTRQQRKDKVLAGDYSFGKKGQALDPELVQLYLSNREAFQAAWVEARLNRHVKKAELSYDKIDPQDLREYLANDLHWNLLLYHELFDLLVEAGRYVMPYERFEMPLSNTLTELEWVGFPVDKGHVDQEKEKMQEELDAIKQRINIVTVSEVTNPNSQAQLSRYLWDIKGLTPPRVHGKPERSTSVQVLDALDPEADPLIPWLRWYRRADKILDSYISNLYQFMRLEEDGFWRVHPGYLQAHVKTGRLSATNPAIQTIPNPSEKDVDPDNLHKEELSIQERKQLEMIEELRKEHGVGVEGNYGKRIKNGYIALPGYTMIDADYSQAELRVAAAWSQDPFMLEAYQNDQDIHSMACDMTFGEGKWTKSMRRVVKGVVFGTVYGGSVESLVSVSSLTREQKAQVVDFFYGRMKRLVVEWRQEMFEQARDKGYIELPYFGTTIFFDLVDEYNKRDVKKWAVNWPVQGTAAKITLKALTMSLPKIKDLGGVMIAHVHDSNKALVPTGKETEAIHLMNSDMEAAGRLVFDSVPFRAEFEVGTRWGALEKWEERN